MKWKWHLGVVAACALCLVLAGCGGGSASQGASGGEAQTDATSSTSGSSNTESSTSTEETSADTASDSDKHDSYFVGKWDLYETEDATHEQIVQVMEQYRTDEEIRKKMNEAYGRDNVEFCATFDADGTGEMDTGLELVTFTWEATNEGAVTFTSFDGKETAMHIPVTDGKFTLNGDTYAKAS